MKTGPVVLAAGGTGGHVFPAESLARVLMRRGHRLIFVTDRRGGAYSGALADVETHRVHAGGIAGAGFLGRVRGAAQLAVGVLQAGKVLAQARPSVVVGFGGYASIPAMIAATRSGRLAAIHEQNAVLGRANRLLAPRVKRIATSFAEVRRIAANQRDKVVYTGMPVRDAVVEMRDRPFPPMTDKLHLLVVGGSQGAAILGEVLPKAIGGLSDDLKQRLVVTQQARPELLEQVQAAYAETGVQSEIAAFFDDLPARLSDAHLLVCRAGASTVAELTTAGRPAILVPYPHAVDDHQTANAHALDSAGGGWLIPQPGFTVEALTARLSELFNSPSALTAAAVCGARAGRPDAAERLADMVEDLIGTNGEKEAA